MLRRLMPTLLLLGLGFLALAWGLASLQRIFLQEAEDARAQLAGRRSTLEQYAREVLARTLQARMEASLPELEAALVDPLLPADHLFVARGGRQYLPRLVRASPGAEGAAREAHAQLSSALAGRTPLPAAGSALALRLAPLAAALSTSDAAPGPAQGAGAPPPRSAPGLSAVASSAGAAAGLANPEPLLLALGQARVEHPLPVPQELALALLVAERLQRGALTPAPVRALVREGYGEGPERLPGLQRELLRMRGRLGEGDFAFLRERIARLSYALQVPADDFMARAYEQGAGALVLPESLGSPTLVGERWYLEPLESGAVRGLAVDPARLLEALARELQEKGLAGKDARVSLEPGGAVQPLSRLAVQVQLPEWAAAEADIAQRYGLKTGLVAACAALAAAIVVLAGVAQHRKYRFVELKSDFVATVSHELRTPLASIRLLAESLERRAGSVPEARDYPQRIVQAADGLHFLVENILSFNRIDKGRWSPRPARVRLEELLGPVREELHAQAPGAELQVEGGDVALQVDPQLARLLLSNLARNACTYNRRSPVRLRLAASLQGARVLVEVQDNGLGIPEGEWERVFQDFYRLERPEHEVHGSGLGLALCRKIMQVHGGHIRVHASSPEGTTFLLSFPAPSHELA
ncbi:HAMP domain-containing histidine kinase [Aggregicoccus sp. 17bor-14]|uniref:sensor histidine kinase n=1 Tax=Myxococcaceae TaxID=31 RepID=UPI00129CFE79|nr:MULTISPECIES: HAMP domain-containing sensor histidine kinase [Myxococcaceae]MBF5043349.1 HAMP domain-containing histidine kinase [Simulacricoccus sp. 17bor-14]MRI89108.1 HAMP domain-containing histidine kinase [Aggregicoccus sp. 17bor-14]